MLSLAKVRRGAALLAVMGMVVLGIGVAQVITSTAANAATGANFVATGHDMDFHCSGGDTDECAYLKIVTDVVRNKSTKPILALDQGTEVPRALTAAGESPVTTVDPSNKTALDAVKFTAPNGTPLFSAIITASDSTCGGCDNTPAGEANINARAADFKTFFNHGGGILALAGADNIATYYNFVPLKGVDAQVVTAPFTVTPTGAKLKITTTMANCCATHNSFKLPTKPIVALETDSKGLAETIAALGVSIGGGGFTSSASTSASHTQEHVSASVLQRSAQHVAVRDEFIDSTTGSHWTQRSPRRHPGHGGTRVRIAGRRWAAVARRTTTTSPSEVALSEIGARALDVTT